MRRVMTILVCFSISVDVLLFSRLCEDDVVGRVSRGQWVFVLDVLLVNNPSMFIGCPPIFLSAYQGPGMTGLRSGAIIRLVLFG
jgi:hypothetical protein